MSPKFFKTILISGVFAILAAGTVLADSRQYAVFRPSLKVWYAKSDENVRSFSAVKLGKEADVLVPADYDGDGVTDFAVWSPNDGIWNIRQSSNNLTNLNHLGGIAGDKADIPVPADYDGDGKADIAVFRPQTGEWFILKSTNTGQKADVENWGGRDDIAVPADYDGDGRADLAYFRPSENRWYIEKSSNGELTAIKFGESGKDVLVPADYTGDGKADVAVYRQGIWYVRDSETGTTEPFVMGFTDGIAVPGDYDGDGQTDFAVFRKGTWYIYDTATPRFHTFNFGLETDVPLNSLKTKPSV
jgi:putative transposon-encoded protein